MANYLSPFATWKGIDSNGNPYSGAQLFTYVAGSTTKVTTYKDEAGSSSHANPIILNTKGEPADGSGVAYPIWQIGGAAVKFVLAPSTDTDPPAAAIETWDNIDGINDTSISIDQWISGPTPTYVSATQFTLVGDQTSTFHVGRRVKTTNSGGTVYGTITVSAYTTLTTVTVVNDSGSFDAGLSAVYYGLITADNTSDPAGTKYGKITFSDLSFFTTGIGPGYIQNYSLSAAAAANALTITLSGYDGTALSSTNKSQFTFRNATAGTGTTSTVSATSNMTLVISSGSTLGATSGTPFRLWWGIVNDAGTLRLAVRNCSTSTAIYSIGDNILISSTAEGGAGAADSAGVWYTGTAVTSKAMRILGYTEHSLTTAGAWDEVPDVIQLWQTGMKLPGDTIQHLISRVTAVSTTSTAIPFDDTIPQNTEGAEITTVSITSNSSTNLVELSAFGGVFGNSSASGAATLAIFQDSTADALVASTGDGAYTAGAVTSSHPINFMKVFGTTSATTFKLRAGPPAGTLTINGNAGLRMLGGVAGISLVVKEIMG